MSNEAYARQQAREVKIWSPFSHSFPFSETQVTERVLVYGLYSGSYLNSRGYLVVIEADALSNLLNDYNSKMSELSNQEQIVVVDITSKRYLSGIDKIIHDEKMVTEGQKISAQDAEWTAKIAALAADSAALDTMVAKVSAETLKANARITELEAYIAIEGLQLSQVEIEIAEKEIQSTKVDIQKLDTANEALRIQSEIVGKASELIDIDVKIANTQVSTGEVQRAIAKIDLLQNDLTVERSQTTIHVSEEGVQQSRNALATAKGLDVTAEIAFQTTLAGYETTDHTNKMNLNGLKNTTKNNALDLAHDKNQAEIDKRIALSDLDKVLADAEANQQIALDVVTTSIMNAKVTDFTKQVNAAILARTEILGAQINTELTHTISKKET